VERFFRDLGRKLTPFANGDSLSMAIIARNTVQCR
jgi:hypothetical protein